MAIPDFQTLMLPVLKTIQTGPTLTQDLIAQIEDEFALSEEERNEMLPSGRQRTIANRTHWAVAYLFKAGLIERHARGLYGVTEEGKAVLQHAPDRIDLSFLTERYESVRNFRDKNTSEQSKSNASASATDTPDQIIVSAIKEIDDLLAADILERTRSLHPTRFEHLILDLMKAMGYGTRGVIQHSGKAGDGGIDGTISEDKLGLDVVYLQAKCYKETNTINPEQVRGFIGALSIKRATKGVFVTTSSFTSGAQDAATMSGQRIVLIDGEELAKLMVKYGIGVRTTETYTVKKADPSYFEEA